MYLFYLTLCLVVDRFFRSFLLTKRNLFGHVGELATDVQFIAPCLSNTYALNSLSNLNIEEAKMLDEPKRIQAPGRPSGSTNR